jgi:HEAT repeat protein
MSKRHVWKTLTVAAVTATSLLVGCEQPKWDDGAYISKMLAEGDAAKQSLALSKLSELSPEKQLDAVPGLVAAYKKGGAVQKDAMQVLVQLRDERAKEAYVEELKTNASNYASASAAALGELNAIDSLDTMVEVLKTTDDVDVKSGIIQAFKYMPEAKLVGPLVEILKLDVDSNPILLHAHACDALAEVAIAHPDAINEDAVKQVTLAVFFANNTNQSVDKECGLTIQALGAKAVPELIKIYKGERADVQSLMLKYDTPNAPSTQNHPKLIAAKRLAALRDKSAVDVLIADLSSVKAAPKELQGQSAVNWRVKEGQVTSETIYALGDIGDPKAKDILVQVLNNDLADEWDDITDGMVELQLRQDAAATLNRLGDRSALPALLKMAENGVVNDFEKRAAILEKQGGAVKEIERYQFNWVVGAEYAQLATAEGRTDWDKVVSNTTAKYPDLAKKMAEYNVMFDLAKECTEKGAPAEQATCLKAKLTDPSPLVRNKAAWELIRLPAEVAGPVLLEALPTEFLDTREIISFGIYRNPTKDSLAKVEEVLAKEANNSQMPYRLDHLRLNYLRAWLKTSAKL